MSEESEQQDSPEPVYTRGKLDTGDYVIRGKKPTYTIDKVCIADSIVTKNLNK